MKTWLTQALNEKFGRRKWFVRDGSTKWVKDEQYFNTVVEYIRRQRVTAFAESSQELQPQVAARDASELQQ